MTKSRLGVLLLLCGALASPGCGSDGTSTPDNGVHDPDVGMVGDAGPDTDAGRLGNGVGCASDDDCDSRACVDGVCCDTACEEVCVSCTAALTGQPDGVCAPSVGNTDPDAQCAETPCMLGLCDGAGACAAIPDGTTCRASAGDCDIVETCAAGACPADAVESEGVVCRGAAGVCDIIEACDGSSSTCPDDEVEPSSASVPACDPYTCSGSTACGTTGVADTDCSFGHFCVCGATNTCVPGRHVFVTGAVHTGNLGGLTGADAICQTRATEAGLSGTFRAWLSSGSLSAAQRIEHYAGPYYRFALPGTLRVAGNWADLANGLDTAAIATDENGASAGSGTYAWTGTFVTGNTDNSSTRCLDWTSADGAQTGTRGWTSAGSSDWTSNGTAACTAALRLYCVETTPPG